MGTSSGWQRLPVQRNPCRRRVRHWEGLPCISESSSQFVVRDEHPVHRVQACRRDAHPQLPRAREVPQRLGPREPRGRRTSR